MMVIGELSLPDFISIHEPFVIFSLPWAAEDSDRADDMVTWPAARVTLAHTHIIDQGDNNLETAKLLSCITNSLNKALTHTSRTRFRPALFDSQLYLANIKRSGLFPM